MKIIRHSTGLNQLSDISRRLITPGLLFLDIETTGLSPKKNRIYCIGIGFLQEDQIRIEQFITEQRDEEKDLLIQAFDRIRNFSGIVTFNGQSFDLPFIQKRAEHFHLTDPVSDMDSIDIYRQMKDIRNFFPFSHFRQKDFEQFLHLAREDRYNGGELIRVYLNYEKYHNADDFSRVQLHNSEDVYGMFQLSALLSYSCFADGRYQITDIGMEKSSFDSDEDSLQMDLKLSSEIPVPKTIRVSKDSFFLLLRDDTAFLSVPVFHMTLRHYFKDYKNYYYLPDEQAVVHKSIGQFVDPAHRQKATRKNCFVSKTGWFALVPADSPAGFYQQDLSDTSSYIDLTDAIQQPDHLSDLSEDPGFLSFLSDVISYLKK